MNHAYILLILLFLSINLYPYDIKKYNVIWNTYSENSWGSMPIGNGDIGANVWVNREGELEFFISKTDAFSELNQLLKIGKLKIKFTPNILKSNNFVQELELKSGTIKISSNNLKDSINLEFWIDANNPVINIIGKSSVPIKYEIINEMWRNSDRIIEGKERHAVYGHYSAPYPLKVLADTCFYSVHDIAWAHKNSYSIYKETLNSQDLNEFALDSYDPLLNNTFGALVTGKNLIRKNNSLITNKVTKDINIGIYTLLLKKSNYFEWKDSIYKIQTEYSLNSLKTHKFKHDKWWKDFWNQHYIIINSKHDSISTFKITQSYMLQRFILASAGRGDKPIKFNGSIFNVDLVENLGNGLKGFNADYRDWGGAYWWQNTRLPYYTMLFSGDYNMMLPLFRMYVDALPICKLRTKKYFKHEGAFMPETFCFWGTYTIDNFGWDRTNKTYGIPENNYIKFYYQSNLEVINLMLDYYDFTLDKNFCDSILFPFSEEVIKFYYYHYPSKNGKLCISPAQSLETYFEGVVNPTPEIAGLHYIIPRLLKLFICKGNYYKMLSELYSKLPDIPTVNSNNGKKISAGYNLGERKNVEKPELYAVFPYRIFGIGRENIEWGINTYNERDNQEYWGWQQDGIFAANLGLIEDARKIVISNYTHKNNRFRFPAFWGPNYDWVPDQDHASVTSRTLQNMIVQNDENNIYLLPAWPDDWNVEFKISLPGKIQLVGCYTKEGDLEVRLLGKTELNLVNCKGNN